MNKNRIDESSSVLDVNDTVSLKTGIEDTEET